MSYNAQVYLIGGPNGNMNDSLELRQLPYSYTFIAPEMLLVPGYSGCYRLARIMGGTFEYEWKESPT